MKKEDYAFKSCTFHFRIKISSIKQAFNEYLKVDFMKITNR